LISIAKSELKRSVVADSGSGESTVSEVRTSSGMFIPKGKVSFFSSFFFGFTYMTTFIPYILEYQLYCIDISKVLTYFTGLPRDYLTYKIQAKLIIISTELQ
jgi:hypothetical protein